MFSCMLLLHTKCGPRVDQAETENKMLVINEIKSFLNCSTEYANQIVDVIDSWNLVNWSEDSSAWIKQQILLANDIIVLGEDSVFGISKVGA